MTVYDISAPFGTDLPVYGGDPNIVIENPAEISKGAGCNVSFLSFGSHTGTHIDVPKHFIDDGKTIFDYSADWFMGEAVVIDATGVEYVTAAHVEGLDNISGKMVLFKTDNADSMLNADFREDYVYVSPEAARLLCEKRVKGVGIDYLSVERYGSGSTTHKLLLGVGMLIIEGVILTDIQEGAYEFIALPLNITGGNGCPVRAVLIRK